MRVAYAWLKELVEFEATPAELAERLTFAGLEVEEVQLVGRAAYKGVVVGRIEKVEPHPAAPDLRVCAVNDGRTDRVVVCGAANMAPGDLAPYAMPGAVLPGGRQIEVQSVKGVMSHGMLCAEDELEVSADHSGIMILPPELAVGTAFSDIMGPPQHVLVIEVTPNRGDCLSMLGVAREVAALYGSRVRLPAVELPEFGPAVQSLASVSVEDREGCPRYTARVLSGVKVGRSPFWMQRRLALCGLRPINNVVDITNYVMLECGQPLHAFDRDLLAEGRIVVRRAGKGERLVTLDGGIRELSPEVLVIADAVRPVAAAGIMGGRGSGIRSETGTVLLESACFDPVRIRRGSKLLGFSTESSYRFERGVDIGMAEWAGRRAAALMVAHAGATAARGVIDVCAQVAAERRVQCRFDRVRDLLGVCVSNDEICGVFSALSLKVVERDQRSCRVAPPSFRPDIENEADLAEEVARIHGLDKIPVAAPRGVVVPDADDSGFRAAVRCRHCLAGLGLVEAVNYSFVGDSILSLFYGRAPDERIRLPNPASAEQSVLRPALVPQMVETLGRNRARQVEEAAFFEMGRVFFKRAGKLAEEERLALGLMGPAGRADLDKRRRVEPEEAFLWAKGILEALCRELKAQVGIVETTAAGESPLECWPWDCLLPGVRAMAVVAGKPAGVVGVVRPEVAAEWRIAEPVPVLEMRLAPLLANAFMPGRAGAIPAYPMAVRDVALIADEHVSHRQIVETIRKVAPPELTAVTLFDIYRGKGIGTGRRSLAYSLTYRSAERTLTDEEANSMHEAIKRALRDGLKAEIREG